MTTITVAQRNIPKLTPSTLEMLLRRTTRRFAPWDSGAFMVKEATAYLTRKDLPERLTLPEARTLILLAPRQPAPRALCRRPVNLTSSSFRDG